MKFQFVTYMHVVYMVCYTGAYRIDGVYRSDMFLFFVYVCVLVLVYAIECFFVFYL